MENQSIKKEMMRLWKENFHDSEEYISLIFDSYFTPEMVEYEERNGRVVAALLGIPYRFGNASNHMNGIYLCGLSTESAHRGEGLMSMLIERFANRIDHTQYPFLFLIPADKGLMKYYHDRGFVNAFYKLPERYVSDHDFYREFINSISDEDGELRSDKTQYYDSLRVLTITTDKDNVSDKFASIRHSEKSAMAKKLRDKICIFIHNKEGERNGLQLMHSSKDIQNAIDECVISGGKIYAILNSQDELCAVGFTYNGEDRDIKLYYHLENDKVAFYKLAETIKKDKPNAGMTIMLYPVKAGVATGLWEPFYGAALPEAPIAGAVGEAERDYYPTNHSEVYGMARILNLYEILKFQAKDKENLKYSILTKQGNLPSFIEYRAENGIVECIDLTKVLPGDEKRKVLMTETDVAEILFRRPDADPIVEEVMELPPLGGSISLMLD